jgi:hypothetical protein
MSLFLATYLGVNNEVLLIIRILNFMRNKEIKTGFFINIGNINKPLPEH